jgi:hypothetical protein
MLLRHHKVLAAMRRVQELLDRESAHGPLVTVPLRAQLDDGISADGAEGQHEDCGVSETTTTAA